MEIITKGQLPGDRLYQQTCTNCRTVFRFKQSECKVEHDLQCTLYLIKCPLEGCGNSTYADERNLVNPKPGNNWTGAER